MNDIYLYKMKSGETVIGEFVRSEVINERTNETAHIVLHPFVVPNGHYDQIREWIPGCIAPEYPISMQDMSLIIAGDESLDSVLKEIYLARVYGSPDVDEPKKPLEHHQL